MGRILLQAMEFRPGSSWTLGKDLVLRFTSTGNLQIWDESEQEIVWETGTLAEKLAMQGDGNLVVYAAGDEPVWASNTDGNPNALLCLDSEGSMSIVSSDLTRTLWSLEEESASEPGESVAAEPSAGAEFAAEGFLSADEYQQQLAALEPRVRPRR
jgi:hypothetical protein